MVFADLPRIVLVYIYINIFTCAGGKNIIWPFCSEEESWNAKRTEVR